MAVETSHDLPIADVPTAADA
jgi:hypothetical protein